MIRVAELHVYPVKACRGMRVSSARVVERGFAGDRRWMIVDAEGRFVTQRTEKRLALVTALLAKDEALELSAPGAGSIRLPATHEAGARRPVQVWSHVGTAVLHPEGSAWISAFLGAPHFLVYMPDDERRPVNPERARPNDIVGFADAYPVLLISEASLVALNARLAAPITMQRFRPNIVVTGCEPFAEDTWATLTIGSLGFRGVKRCDRCVVTTVDPETAEAGVEPLRTLATFRREDGKVWFGMNLIHDGPGTLRVGDELTPGVP
ncbi:MAG TPA: MOSC N-terminal beta barrel domain-containing protein [Polyangiaceae bacterium]|nr:MOSC N-terminal beta barrel domain-containing protein [Polyangiaceae bacterium]